MPERNDRILEARHAIEGIVLGYAAAVDAADLETLSELLRTCTVQLPGGVVLEGGDAVRRRYAEMIIFYDDDERPVAYRRRACSPRTRHVTTNLTFSFNDEVTEARTECYVTVLQTLGGEIGIIAAGRYFDTFELGAEGWRVVERRLVLDASGDMRRHTRR